MVEIESVIEEVIATERAWVRAHRDLDIETLDRILSEDYKKIGADGSVIGKTETLASYASMKRRWDFADSDEYQINVYGDVAVLVGRWIARGENDEEAFDYSARFMSVYVLTDDGWKLVAEQSTPID
jgi:ketosteroid isomerase-like protein